MAQLPEPDRISKALAALDRVALRLAHADLRGNESNYSVAIGLAADLDHALGLDLARGRGRSLSRELHFAREMHLDVDLARELAQHLADVGPGVRLVAVAAARTIDVTQASDLRADLDRVADLVPTIDGSFFGVVGAGVDARLKRAVDRASPDSHEDLESRASALLLTYVAAHVLVAWAISTADEVPEPRDPEPVKIASLRPRSSLGADSDRLVRPSLEGLLLLIRPYLDEESTPLTPSDWAALESVSSALEALQRSPQVNPAMVAAGIGAVLEILHGHISDIASTDSSLDSAASAILRDAEELEGTTNDGTPAQQALQTAVDAGANKDVDVDAASSARLRVAAKALAGMASTVVAIDKAIPILAAWVKAAAHSEAAQWAWTVVQLLLGLFRKG